MNWETRKFTHDDGFRLAYKRLEFGDYHLDASETIQGHWIADYYHLDATRGGSLGVYDTATEAQAACINWAIRHIAELATAIGGDGTLLIRGGKNAKLSYTPVGQENTNLEIADAPILMLTRFTTGNGRSDGIEHL